MFDRHSRQIPTLAPATKWKLALMTSPRPSPNPIGGEIPFTRISHRLTGKAHDKPAITSLRLLAVLNVLSSTPPRAKRRAPRTDGSLMHFASPPDEKCGLKLR